MSEYTERERRVQERHKKNLLRAREMLEKLRQGASPVYFDELDHFLKLGRGEGKFDLSGFDYPDMGLTEEEFSTYKEAYENHIAAR